MKLALPSTHRAPFRIPLTERGREILLALVLTLIPYAVAAIGVFAYHGQ